MKDVAHPPDQLFVVFAMGVRPGSVKLGSFLDGQFQIVGICIEEVGVGDGGSAELGVGAVDSLHRPKHVLLHAHEDFIGCGPEELFLAAEVAIDGPFADARPVGNDLDVGVLKSAFREGANRLLHNGGAFFGIGWVGTTGNGHKQLPMASDCLLRFGRNAPVQSQF